MSYNYDSNPWDDNYSSTNQGQNVQQPAENYSTAGAYSANNPISGYSNPAAQYTTTETWNDPAQGVYDYNASEQQTQYSGSSYQQPNAGLSTDAPPPPPPPPLQPPESGLKRFLRAHVPFCGSCMDLSSAICTPILDTLLKYVNRDLLVSKIFYFFFYSAFGSLFPLMGVYFKQLGMNPAQVGILTGVRPFIEIFSAPFWSGLAERFQKGKVLLLFSLISWIIFTYSLARIRPPASACVAFNDTDYVLYTPYSDNDLRNYDIAGFEQEQQQESSTENSNEISITKSAPIKASVVDGEQNALVRRRKKRQAESHSRPREQLDRPHLSRYVYSVDDPITDGEFMDGNDQSRLNIDLENDFDDAPLESRNSDGRMLAHLHSAPAREAHSFFGESAESNGDNDDDSELESGKGKNLWRYKRDEFDQGQSEPNESESEKSAHNNQVRQKSSNEDDENNNVEDESGEIATANKPEDEHGGDENSEREAGEMDSANEKNRGSRTEERQTVQTNNKIKRIYRQRHKTPPTHIVGMSPITVQYAANYNKEKHSQFVTPMFSTIVYKLDDIKEVFFLLLLLISLGEFFSAPAITIADSITLQYLGENTDSYGRQRTFGSLGWAITLMLVGMALDNSTEIADHPCGPHRREKNYTVCFTIFSLLMGCAFVTATQFNFYYSQKKNNYKSGSQALVTSTTENDQIITTTAGDRTTANIDDLYASTRPREIFNTAPPVNAPPPGNGLTGHGGKEKFEFLDKWKSAMFAQRTRELPEWVNVFRQFLRHPMHVTYLFITWFLGCGVGLVFTFLFWHLQDVGGTPTLFGICSVINHISEVLAYFFSSHFIKRYGHTKVLSVGLGCNLIRFLYVAFLSNPYYALPFELVQGITHAACFAACCSYMSHVSKPELRTSTQGVMQGLHHGIGRACGTLLGGYLINAIGSRASFCIYGLLSGCVLGGFLYIRKKASLVEDEEVKVDDSEALGGYGAPQGVPSAIPGKITTQTVQQQEIDYQW